MSNITTDFEFVYNNELKFLENFRFWKHINDLEREAWGLNILTYDEALKLFSSLYENSVDK